MSSDLYGEAIKSLAAAPSGRLVHPDAVAVLDNSLCGDRVTVELGLADGRAAAFGHEVKGCLLCKAAATLVAGRAVGMDGEAAALMLGQVAAMLKSGAQPGFAGLEVLAPVAAHKSRHDCVLLPFKALAKALPCG